MCSLIRRADYLSLDNKELLTVIGVTDGPLVEALLDAVVNTSRPCLQGQKTLDARVARPRLC